MPVEIRELTIRVSVNPPQDGHDKSGPSSPGWSGGGAPRQPVDSREEIIVECVERVLERLRELEER